ncbi:MAG: bifunctional phosphoribosylaminoimidazolecarboxamide formyltransferase/IMP cyclohydrolase [Bacteroidales bacterium]|nr:bifunctional phosphoribosylaminoimidazolecarboxamide formyltransferase/IMP cyclohydrolase [Bacteroidales bacterium]
MLESSDPKSIKRALVSVYYKNGLDPVLLTLRDLNVEIFSTGGTLDYIANMGVPVTAVEELTNYPAILGGRVKTLHPKIFGGILARRNHEHDLEELSTYSIPPFDLVIVDLYPFAQTVSSGASEQEVIEKIDIGGISLIRAAAKNHKDLLIVSSKEQYPSLLQILSQKRGQSCIEERKRFALEAFQTTSRYDTAIYNYFNGTQTLRYGENPHQSGRYHGNPELLPKQLHGKELSYNNLLDVEAAVELIADFSDPTIAIIKHNNACGCASDASLTKAWEKALAADPLSAFGGVIISNRPIEADVAQAINALFFEILVAPVFSQEALDILTTKKNRILLRSSPTPLPKEKFRSLLHGVLVQEQDQCVEGDYNMIASTLQKPNPSQIADLLFANKLVKHSKSNAIVLAKDQMLLASGVGQTSRIDALRQAIEKAQRFGFPLDNAVMASDAFFPFSDCVEMAHKAGITSIIQPGGSVRDQESIDYCNAHHIAMICTGFRHFKH